MNHEQAASLLGVSPFAPAEEAEAAFNKKRDELERSIVEAPTPALKEKYRASLRELETARQGFSSAADDELPQLTPHYGADRPRPDSVGAPGRIKPIEPEQRKRQAAVVGKRIFSVALKLGIVAGLIFGGAVLYDIYQRGPEMVKISGGSFSMGSHSGERGRNEDEKQHRVSVGDFWLAKNEVTNAQYRKFKPRHNSGTGFNYDNQPVVNIFWNDATAYAEWLSQETGKKYRLPTEAEWEYACRAGGQDRYCGGNDLDALGWYGEHRDSYTRHVGGKRANAWGLHDMSGNVREWTCSAYDKDYGGDEKQCSSKNDATVGRVLRGGSWSGYTRNSRAADRIYLSPSIRDNDIGFRLARTLSP